MVINFLTKPEESYMVGLFLAYLEVDGRRRKVEIGFHKINLSIWRLILYLKEVSC